ncbi:MAG: tetratricopeptide repeat protein [Melioribacteraceae bacterium]|nr:tetratricopeptide repeat protein [Melioribacteraceae bacterium]
MKTKHLRLVYSSFLIILFSYTLPTSAQIDEMSITSNSESAKDSFLKGRYFYEAGNHSSAKMYFEKALTNDADLAIADIYLSVIENQDYNTVVSHIEKAVSLSNKVSLGERIFINFIESRFNKNEPLQKVHLSKLLTLFPKDKRIQYLSGEFYYDHQEYDLAITYLNNTIALDSAFAISYKLLGLCNMASDNQLSAKKSFQKYIALLPYEPDPYNSLGEFLLEQGNYEESIAGFNEAITRDQTFTKAVLGIGHNYIYQKKFEEARDFYQRSFVISETIPEKLKALYWISTSYIHEGNIDEALNANLLYRELAKTNLMWTDVIESYNREGLILTETGMAEEAISKFNNAGNIAKSANLQNSTKEYYSFIANVNKCYALTYNNMLEKADIEAQKCILMTNKRNNKNELKLLNGTLGILAYKNGDFVKAINLLKNSDMENVYNIYQMGVVYEKMGNKQRADEIYSIVKSNKRNSLQNALVRERVRD